MLLKELDYNIPRELIALYPKIPRDESKLVLVDKKFKIIKFKELIDYLSPNDAIVFNDTKVICACLKGFLNNKKVEINLNQIIDKKNCTWSAFIKCRKRPFLKDEIFFSKFLKAKVTHIDQNYGTDIFHLQFSCNYKTFMKKLNSIGIMPLPPYINKKRETDGSDFFNYQTIFARKEGAVASPTASLHFSNKLIKNLKEKKISIINVTLHANAGTFLPIKVKNILNHKMHFEYGIISKKSSKEINIVKKRGGKIIAVGTTVLRILESAKEKDGSIKPFRGETNIFIKPGTKVNTIDGLITNFHTPKSTLLLLIYSLIGKKKTKELYNFAIKNKLRFFSYGDASLIWSENEKI